MLLFQVGYDLLAVFLHSMLENLFVPFKLLLLV